MTKKPTIIALSTVLSFILTTGFPKTAQAETNLDRILTQRFYSNLMDAGVSPDKALKIARIMLRYPQSRCAQMASPIIADASQQQMSGGFATSYRSRSVAYNLMQTNLCDDERVMHKEEQSAEDADDIRLFGSKEHAKAFNEAGGHCGNIPGEKTCEQIYAEYEARKHKKHQ